MSNTAGMCYSFWAELMQGTHALGPGTLTPARTAGVPDTVKAALFLASASRGPADTTYNTTGELAGTGNYTQGGVAVTMANAPSVTSGVAHFTPTASFSWTAFSSSGPFDTCVLYNASQADRQISVHTFGAQSIVAGNFSLTMPVDDDLTGLLRFS
jgi:hypothetical protein